MINKETLYEPLKKIKDKLESHLLNNQVKDKENFIKKIKLV
jgi:hypothetical protein